MSQRNVNSRRAKAVVIQDSHISLVMLGAIGTYGAGSDVKTLSGAVQHSATRLDAKQPGAQANPIQERVSERRRPAHHDP